MAQKVLVVDDELHMRTFISTLLETNGYKPLVAEDGTKGMELVRKHTPALVITDVMMPKESGVDMYRQIKEDPDYSNIPIIVVSAVSKKTFFHSQKVLSEHKGEEVSDPDAYIEKPPEAEELLEAIKKSIG